MAIPDGYLGCHEQYLVPESLTENHGNAEALVVPESMCMFDVSDDRLNYSFCMHAESLLYSPKPVVHRSPVPCHFGPL